MRAGSILNPHDVTPCLRQHVQETSRVALRIQAPCMPCVEQPSGARVDEAKHLVAFPLAAGGPFGLLALGSPGGAARAPLGKAGCIATEQQGLALPCVLYNARP